MLKKYIISLCALTCSVTLPMERQNIESPLATQFFKLCKKGKDNKLVGFLTIHGNDKSFDINSRDKKGRTGLLCAAKHNQWPTVCYLLNNTAADKMASDQSKTTVLSCALYSNEINKSSSFFDAVAKKYSPEEIYTLVKDMPLSDYQQQFVSSIQPKLKKGDDINEPIYINGETFLHQACYYKIPLLIWQLARKGASFDAPQNNTPYEYLYSGYDYAAKQMFILRELFTFSMTRPTIIIEHAVVVAHKERSLYFLVYQALKTIECSDVTKYITTLYMQLQQYALLKKQQQYAWKPILDDVTKELNLTNITLDNISEQSAEVLRNLSLHGLQYEVF